MQKKNRWFTSDLHFNHDFVLEKECAGLFETHRERNQKIFDAWSRQVGDDDVVYFLGDFGFLEGDEALDFKNLPGTKVFMRGNHDRQRAERYLELGFAKVVDYPLYVSGRVALSHYPIVVGGDVLNLHGHLHRSRLDSPNHVNVGIHMQGYKLYGWDDVERKLSKMPRGSDKFMYEWYAEKQIFDDKSRKDIAYFEDGRLDVAETRRLLEQAKRR